jgi:TPR repeat protein
MILDSQDFPLYDLIDKVGGVCAERARIGLVKAQTGSDEDRFEFAMNMYTVAAPQEPPNPLPGESTEMAEQTLSSCLTVFKQVAAHGHGMAAYMTASCYFNGYGCAQDFNTARIWIEKAEAIDGPKPWIQRFRSFFPEQPAPCNGLRP